MNRQHQPDDYRWDPEKAYGRKSGGSLRLIAFILVVVALGAAAIYYVKQHQEASGDFPLTASMSFDRADQMLRDAGYIPVGLREEQGNYTVQYYTSPAVFGITPSFSALEYLRDPQEGGYRIGYAFDDDRGSSWEKQGAVFRLLEDRLTEQFGDPEVVTNTGGPCLSWSRSDSSRVLLGYMSAGMPALYYLYDQKISL